MKKFQQKDQQFDRAIVETVAHTISYIGPF